MTGTAAGLHLLAWLPPGLEEAVIIERAREHGLALYGIVRLRLRPSSPGGLIFGYANLTEPEIVAGVKLLASIIASVTTRS